MFENEGVTAENILEPHQASTLERINLERTVLFLQDTSTLSFPTQVERDDTGPVNGENTRGMFLHPTLVVTPEQNCLGVLSAYCWYRDTLANLSPKERSKHNHQRDLEDKETYRWLQGYRLANDYAQKLSSTQVVVAGR